jgi:bisanhydrobacterioruberin hydratase
VFTQILRATPRSLILASALFFGTAYFAVRFPDVPGMSVGSYASTFLIALPSLIALFRYLGTRQAALSLLALSAFSYAIEAIGVATGFPYGSFYYGDALGEKAFGLVPYLLPVSYTPLAVGGVAASWSCSLVRNYRFLLIFRSAVLLTLMDGVLDPGAASLGLWAWPEGGAYYGVPPSNYAGWLLSGSLAAALLLAAGRWRTTPVPGLLDSVVLALAFWTGVAAFSGLAVPALLGATLLTYLLHRRSRLRSYSSQHTTPSAGQV